ncbi:MAG TPA: hypothetical protein VMT74_01160 [Gaiellaceae bacterium]|nr:hypothetical protein [Gaiellaceae bacterium]
MLRSLAAITALIVFLALPCAGLAVNGPVGGTDLSGATSSGPVNYLRDAKYTPAPTATAVPVVRVVRPGGFDYRDAGVGAAIAVLAVALAGGVIVLIRGTRTPHATAH